MFYVSSGKAFVIMKIFCLCFGVFSFLCCVKAHFHGSQMNSRINLQLSYRFCCVKEIGTEQTMINQKRIHLYILIWLAITTGCSTSQGPANSDGQPLIIKSGTIDADLVETTPIVFNNKVYRFEYVRKRYWNNQTAGHPVKIPDPSPPEKRGAWPVR